MTDFNPFGKPIERIRKTDLAKLVNQEIAEGWFVEYKGDFVSPKKIGHSIASFANSDGGWYIIGVESNSDNVATNISGFDLTAYRNPVDKMKDCIKSHISPLPYFATKLVRLSNNRGVLITYISRGDESPYVTSDGKIYRRVNAASEPIPETDRYSIQKLFERSEIVKDRINAFCSNPYGMSQGQDDRQQCFVELYIYTRPFDAFKINGFYEESFFKQLTDTFRTPAEFVKNVSANAAFNAIYSSSQSYILRHIATPEQEIDLGLTAEIFSNGNMRVIFPMPELPIFGKKGVLLKPYESSSNFLEFSHTLTEKDLYMVSVIDTYTLFVVIVTLFRRYASILKASKYKGQLGARIELTETWRKVLFFDQEEYIQHIKEHGVPIGLKSSITIPSDTTSITLKSDADQGFLLFAFIIEALGCPIVIILYTA